MSTQYITTLQEKYNLFCDSILGELKENEEATISLDGEKSDFIRFSKAKVRQATNVTQGFISFTYIANNKTMKLEFPFCGDLKHDIKQGIVALNQARKDCENLPEDPFVIYPKNNGTSDENHYGELLDKEKHVKSVLSPAQNLDLCGLFISGLMVRASRNSKGQNHWFSTESFCTDYSIYNGPKAVKGAYAGTDWNQDQYEKNIKDNIIKLEIMNRPKKEIQRGKYRTYLAPDAVAETTHILGWGSLSEGGIRRGESSLLALKEGNKTLSNKFSISENFDLGLTPRFNEMGELSPNKINLIENGELKELLVSSRTAKEYGLESNGADAQESPSSLDIATGNLKEENILSELGTGLYLSNLHYLNYSDRQSGRITGMTRYACFYVENGEIVAPINDLRFDETLYNFLGQNLVAVTDFAHVIPTNSTYFQRALGGCKVPGIIVDNFSFTL